MAKIKSREATGELFPPSSLIAVSDDLHIQIIRAIEKQFGPRLKKITKGKITEILNTPFLKKDKNQKHPFGVFLSLRNESEPQNQKYFASGF